MSNRVREIPEVAAGVRRMVRALGRRIGREGDPVDLLELVELKRLMDDALTEAVRAMHDGEGGFSGQSYAQIAAGLGTSRQAVQQRCTPRFAGDG